MQTSLFQAPAPVSVISSQMHQLMLLFELLNKDGLKDERELKVEKKRCRSRVEVETGGVLQYCLCSYIRVF